MKNLFIPLLTISCLTDRDRGGTAVAAKAVGPRMLLIRRLRNC
jgi:hypothetical protein